MSPVEATKFNSTAAFRQWVARYANSLELYVREVKNAEPEKWQLDVIRAIDGGAKRVSIRSGHGVGKSTLLSWIADWFLMTRLPQKTVVTAPSKNQLWDAFWPELRTWISRSPKPLQDLLEIKAERIELKAAPYESFISAKVSRADQPEALQGVHSENVLLILDEASGVPDEVIDAAGGSMSGSNTLMVMAGNPVRTSGFFFDSHNRLSHLWATFKVSVFDSRYASAEYASMVEARYGKDSNQYRVRVLGEFPYSEEDVVIPFEMVESAVGRDVTVPDTQASDWGLDVAGGGTNRTVLVKRRGNVVTEPPKVWGGLDDAQVVGRVKAEWDATPEKLRPGAINIDAIGLGAAVARGLKALGLPANAVNVAETPSLESDGYRNLKAELWFKGRRWFAARDSRLPERDPEHRVEDMIEELSTQTFSTQPLTGKIIITPKKGHRSPDLADAFILSLATESAMMTGAARGSFGKRPALSNPLKGLP